MATEAKSAAWRKEVQVPEWEHIATQKAEKDDLPIEKKQNRPFLEKSAARFDAIMPPNRRYLKMKRRTFLLLLLGVTLALLALIIGLAAGLSHHGSGTSNLPLPSNSATFTGDLTYYAPGLGACGETSTESDDILAISHTLFDQAGSTSSNGGNSNANPLCNRMIRAQRYNEEAGETRSVDLKVVDRCVGCAVDDLDVTESVFAKLAPVASGRVTVTWAWL